MMKNDLIRNIIKNSFTERERDLVSNVFQNYYWMDIDEIAEENGTAKSLFIKLGILGIVDEEDD